MKKLTFLDRWLVDAFRCASITHDDDLEYEVLFINSFKQSLYTKKHN
jgi:hypothetical protein